MSYSPIYTGPERRRRRGLAPPVRRRLPAADMESWLVPPRAIKPSPVIEPVFPRQPMEPTRLDYCLPEPGEIHIDYVLPEETPFWATWAEAQIEREAFDAGGTAFAEAIELTGTQACIKRVNFSTNRVVEKENRQFRFAQDINTVLEHVAKAESRRRFQLQLHLSWGYVLGLLSALLFLILVKSLHIA